MKIECVGDGYQCIDAFEGFNPVARGNPVVNLVQFIKVRVLDGEDHYISLLTKRSLKPHIIPVSTVGRGQQVGIFVRHLQMTYLETHEKSSRQNS